jgi:hypothetical protein
MERRNLLLPAGRFPVPASGPSKDSHAVSPSDTSSAAPHRRPNLAFDGVRARPLLRVQLLKVAAFHRGKPWATALSFI